MAGMFYSLEEAAKKLGKTEEEVKLLATEGKLREFRDGSVVMFKIDEVDALLAESGLEFAAEEDLALDSELSTETDDLEQFLDLDSPDEEAEPALAEEAPAEPLQMDEEPAPEPELEPAGEVAEMSEDDLLMFEPDPEQEPELESIAEPEGIDEELLVAEPAAEDSLELREDLDALLGLDEEEPVGAAEAAEEPVLEAEAQEDLVVEDELGLAESGIDMMEDAGEELSDDTLVAAEPDGLDGGNASQEDLFLTEAAGSQASEPTDMDTALTGEGISVLGESDADFKLTDDTLAETLAGLGATGETSLEEIEDDINLDSFGSGSGLLDLSLQADDTSLGGILDEIYTTDEEGGAPDDNLGTADEVTAEADSLISESKLEASVEEDYAPAVVMTPRAMAELAPDSSSNLLGGLLFLPLILLIFTTLVTLAGLGGFSPPLIGSIAGFIWYIMGGLGVVGLILGIVGIVGGGGGGSKPKKAKKVKKKKEPKKKKEKKEKKPKAKKEKKKKK
jgi:hypothetical protein